MRVLVTGGAGYIGSHAVVELLAAGHEPVIVDSLVNAKPTVIDRVEDITGYRVPLHRFDIRDEGLLDELLAADRFEAVLHFAGLKAVGESVERPLAYYNANVSGSVTLLEAMERHGIRTIVFSSSATVYGDPLAIPVTESMPTGSPTNPYGWTKLMIEQILRDVHAGGDGWSVALLRYFNPVGAHPSGVIGEDPEGLPNNLMPYISQVAVERLPELRVFGNDYPTRDGTGVRDYIHVVISPGATSPPSTGCSPTPGCMYGTWGPATESPSSNWWRHSNGRAG
jgi:UDP-glucose 4-epimerase